MKLLIQYGPAAAGLVIVLVFLLFNRTKQMSLPRPVRLMTGLGLGLVTIYYVASSASGVWPGWKLPLPIPSGPDEFLYSHGFSYALPLALTIVVLIFLIFPVPASGASGTATLAPRGFNTFASRRWVTTVAVLVFGSLLTAVLAGLASSPDEQGRYVHYILKTSDITYGTTTFYGWWFSVPCLFLIAIITAVAFWGISAISRPALAMNAERDTRERTVRVRNILIVISGGLLLHLAAVLIAIATTAGLSAGVNSGDQGMFYFITSFAALRPSLVVAGYACMVLGLAFWWLIILSAATTKTSARSKVAAP